MSASGGLLSLKDCYMPTDVLRILARHTIPAAVSAALLVLAVGFSGVIA